MNAMIDVPTYSIPKCRKITGNPFLISAVQVVRGVIDENKYLRPDGLDGERCAFDALTAGWQLDEERVVQQA